VVPRFRGTRLDIEQTLPHQGPITITRKYKIRSS